MKLNKTLIAVIAAVVIIGGWAASAYNSMVQVQETTTTALANVQSTYQRRADLIPNLVETVKGYAAHEKQTLEDVVAARSKATSINLDPSNMTPEKLKEFQQAQGELGTATCRYSWKVPKTASTRLATSITRPFSSIMSLSDHSPRTSSPACSDSSR